MTSVLDGPLGLVWLAMVFAGWLTLLQFEELVDRSWRQRIASVLLLVLIISLLGASAKAVYLPDEPHTYYCSVWSWWPWSGC